MTRKTKEDFIDEIEINLSLKQRISGSLRVSISNAMQSYADQESRIRAREAVMKYIKDNTEGALSAWLIGLSEIKLTKWLSENGLGVLKSKIPIFPDQTCPALPSEEEIYQYAKEQ